MRSPRARGCPSPSFPTRCPAPLPALLGVLGHTGLTAYVGLEIGRPRAGETVVVSAAAGAVGSVAGQIAKARGARVVGIAGGAREVPTGSRRSSGSTRASTTARGDWREQLDAATPDGVDVDFENVGGEIMDHVLMRLNRGARVVLCGMISQYDAAGAGRTWHAQVNIDQILMQRATMRGFIVLDHADLFSAGREELARLLAEGRLRREETIVEGLEQLPAALRRLFTGDSVGKLLVRIAEPSGRR